MTAAQTTQPQVAAKTNKKRRNKKARKSLNLMRFVPWMLAMSLFSMLTTLFLISGIVQQETLKAENQLATAEAVLAAPIEVDPEEEALRESMLALQAQVNEIGEMYATIMIGYTNWPQIMAILNNYDHNQMAVKGLAYSDRVITLNGQAAEEQLVILYTALLEEAGLFSQVTVRSIGLGEVEEGALPIEFSLLIEIGQPEEANENE